MTGAEGTITRDSETHWAPGAPWGKRLTVAAVFAVAAALFMASSAPTITWWNSPELAIASHDLGVTSPPGAVIPTILGWIVLKLTPGPDSARVLNLFAAVLGAVLAASVLLIGSRITQAVCNGWSSASKFAAVSFWVASAGATLAFALGDPLWEYALQYTAYIVTPVFTAMIFGAMLGWWLAEDESVRRRWLFLTLILFGLDLSVHRTNFLLLPALPIWVLLRSPRSFLSVRNWLAVVFGLVIGLGFHVVMMAMAAHDPFLNMGDPSTFDRFLSYVRLDQQGGGFLINLYPRNAEFWSVQVADWVRAFAATYAPVKEFVGLAGVIPLLTGLWGLGAITRRSMRLGIALLVLFLSTVICTIVYFNIPENYFRSLHRHYLPSLVLFAPFVVVGAQTLISRLGSLFVGWRIALAGLVALCQVVGPLAHLPNYWRLHGGMHYAQFASDYARNLLLGLPPNSILLTNGDNDTFPVWYVQAVEGVRPDVVALNIPLLNTGWFVRQTIRKHPDLSLRLTDSEIDSLAPVAWRDSVLRVPSGTLSESDSEAEGLPDSILVTGTSFGGAAYLLVQDQVVLQLLQGTGLQRPVYIAGNLPEGSLPWLRPHLRMEGLVQRVVPDTDVPPDTGILRENLLHTYVYRGFDGGSLSPDRTSVGCGENLVALHLMLAQMYLAAADTTSAVAVCDHMDTTLSPEWGAYSEYLRMASRQVRELCRRSPERQ